MTKYRIAGKKYATGAPIVETIIADNEAAATAIFNVIYNANANIIKIVFESQNKELSLLIEKYQRENKMILPRSALLVENVRNLNIQNINTKINNLRNNTDNIDAYVDLYETLLSCVLEFGYYFRYNNHRFDPSESTVNEGETFDFVVGELLDSFDKFKRSYINSHLKNIIFDVESLVFIKGFADEFHKKLTEKLQ